MGNVRVIMSLPSPPPLPFKAENDHSTRLKLFALLPIIAASRESPHTEEEGTAIDCAWNHSGTAMEQHWDHGDVGPSGDFKTNRKLRFYTGIWLKIVEHLSKFPL